MRGVTPALSVPFVEAAVRRGSAALGQGPLTQMQLQFPQLASSAYRAAVETEIRKRGYSTASMLQAADAATTWDKSEALHMVRPALERQHLNYHSNS
jgi:hypothetical protein